MSSSFICRDVVGVYGGPAFVLRTPELRRHAFASGDATTYQYLPWVGAAGAALDAPHLSNVLLHNLGVSFTICLDFLHTHVSGVLFERTLALVPVAFRQQAFERPALVPYKTRKGRAPRSTMSATLAATYSKGKMYVVHARYVFAGVTLAMCHRSPLSVITQQSFLGTPSLRTNGSVRAISGAHFNGKRRLRKVNPDKMGFCGWNEKSSYVSLMALVLPAHLCHSEAGRVRPS